MKVQLRCSVCDVVLAIIKATGLGKHPKLASAAREKSRYDEVDVRPVHALRGALTPQHRQLTERFFIATPSSSDPAMGTYLSSPFDNQRISQSDHSNYPQANLAVV